MYYSDEIIEEVRSRNDIVDAVSYTHLDVYKRQDPGRRWFRQDGDCGACAVSSCKKWFSGSFDGSYRGIGQTAL